MKKREDRKDHPKKLSLNRETVKSLSEVQLSEVAGAWSAWSVTWQGGPTCIT